MAGVGTGIKRTMEKINIAELLKGCPKGMELDCAMYDNLYLDCIREHPIYPIVCYTIDSKGEKYEMSFNWYGKYSPIDTSKCIIFPKGKTTWEGFHRPFKDGDILTTDLGSVFVLKEPNENVFYYSCYVALTDVSCIITSRTQFCGKNRTRLATEEEKQKLFDAIKANGYKWNEETKTLEKVEPEFKVGDKIREKGDEAAAFTISDIDDSCYYCGEYVICNICDQDKYELVPNKFDISTLKPFDKVLARDTDNSTWTATFFSHLRGKKFYTVGGWYNQCILFDGNEHLLGKCDECDEFYKNW